MQISLSLSAFLFAFVVGLAGPVHAEEQAAKGECPYMKAKAEAAEKGECPHMKAKAEAAEKGECPHMKAGDCPCHKDGDKGDCACAKSGEAAAQCPCHGKGKDHDSSKEGDKPGKGKQAKEAKSPKPVAKAEAAK